jgi:hypothetical protein
LSIHCSACGADKDLHYMKSGMATNVAIQRLLNWRNACQPNHNKIGGRLLVDCA